jgi:hypothetical protein
MTLLLAVSSAGYGLDCLITGARIAGDVPVPVEFEN